MLCSIQVSNYTADVNYGRKIEQNELTIIGLIP